MKVKISGMTCVHCEIFLKKVLSNLIGVSKVVEVSRERGDAIIEGNPDTEMLVTVIGQHGYNAKVEH